MTGSGFRVIKSIDFCYGHRLYRYGGKCKNVHGHNGRLEIVIAASKLDDLGMVVDFSGIKSKIKSWVDDELDHRMLVMRDDPSAARLKALDPEVVLLDFNPTAENLARHIFSHVKKMGFAVCEVRLWETESSCAAYKETST
ncbi:MAG: 6-carboxytetrahydropterin synthase [Elusimicrobiota bacterium]